MKTRVALLILTTGVALATAVHAQPPTPSPREQAASPYVDPVSGLTLEDAIAQALDREPSLRAARSDVDGARGMRVQSGLGTNPTVSFSRQYEPDGTDRQTRVEIVWPLDLFRKTGRAAVAEREIEATRHATADQERMLIAEVRLKYGEVAAAVREIAVADDLLAATSRQHRLLVARVEQGATPPLERDMVRVELQRLESDRLLQAGYAERALIELKRLLGLAPGVPLQVRDTLEELVRKEAQWPVASDSAVVIRDRADVQEAGARVEVAEAQIDRARRDGRFDVSLFGMYMRMDAGFPQRGFTDRGDLERVRGDFNYLAAGAMVTVPLRNRSEGDVAVAEAAYAGATARLEATELTARTELAAAQVRDDHARRALAVYDGEARTLSRQNLDVVGRTYELGRATVFDVLTEQRRYLDVERAYTSALREAYEARQALRRALGGMR